MILHGSHYRLVDVSYGGEEYIVCPICFRYDNLKYTGILKSNRLENPCVEPLRTLDQDFINLAKRAAPRILKARLVWSRS